MHKYRVCLIVCYLWAFLFLAHFFVNGFVFYPSCLGNYKMPQKWMIMIFLLIMSFSLKYPLFTF